MPLYLRAKYFRLNCFDGPRGPAEMSCIYPGRVSSGMHVREHLPRKRRFPTLQVQDRRIKKWCPNNHIFPIRMRFCNVMFRVGLVGIVLLQDVMFFQLALHSPEKLHNSHSSNGDTENPRCSADRIQDDGQLIMVRRIQIKTKPWVRMLYLPV